jgi:hypothetical protein
VAAVEWPRWSGRGVGWGGVGTMSVKHVFPTPASPRMTIFLRDTFAEDAMLKTV